MLTVVANIVHRVSQNQSVLNVVLSNAASASGVDSSWLSQWSRVDWLLQCTVYRPVELRTLSLCILSHLCLIAVWARAFTSFEPTVDTKTLLASRSRTLPPSGGRLWCIAISVLLDSKEACCCYVHAVDILTNLTSLPIDSRMSGIFMPPVLQDPQQVGSQAPNLQQITVSSSGQQISANEHPSSGLQTEVLNRAAFTTDANATVPAGDQPTLTTSSHTDEDSSVLDLRDLLNSDMDSSELRQNFALLLNYLRPWYNELFLGRSVQSSDTVPVSDAQPLLIHTSAVPQDTLLPCCFDPNSGLCLLGLPALQHLVIGQNLVQLINRFLTSYLPQPIMKLSRWKELSSGFYSFSTDSGEFTSTTPQSIGTTGQQSAEQFPTGTVHHVSTSSSSTTKVTLCTPLLVSSICQLLTNLLHHLPQLISTELTKYEINSLLMNIVDPSLLEVLLKIVPHTTRSESSGNGCTDLLHHPASPWSSGIVQLSSAFAACLRVLRCEAALNESVRSQLGSDARFLARLIRSVKHTDFTEFLFPVWRELFTLLTCILMSSEDEKNSNLWTRLILRPLAAYVDSWLDILLTTINHAEAELNQPIQNNWTFCRYARSALCFLIVMLSKHRPLSSNPIICALDSEPNVTSSFPKLVRKIVSLITSNSVPVDQTNAASKRHPFSLLVSSKLPTPVINYRRTLLTTLRTLLGVCRSAKAVALEEELLEELLINIQLIHAKLELCCITASSSSTDVRRPASFRGQSQFELRQVTHTWTSLTEELIAHFEIVHNLTYVYPEAKRRAVDVGFPQLVHQLWPLGLQDTRILHALLSLLTNLTADCPYGASALAKSVNVVQPATVHGLLTPNMVREVESAPQTGRRLKTGACPNTGRSKTCTAQSDQSSVHLSGCSFIQMLCQLLRTCERSTLTACTRSSSNTNLPATARSLTHSEISTDVPILNQEVTCRLVYQLLANMVWSTEARSALVKTKLLRHCVTLDPRVLSKSRRGQFILSLWLQLLVNLSFTTDGQQVLCGQPRLPEMLDNCVVHLKGYNRETALLALRNLCINTVFKTRFVTGETQLLDCIKGLLLRMEQPTNGLRLVTLSVSMVQALAHGNEKARALIRSTGFLHHLTQLWTWCQASSDYSDLVPKVQSLLKQLQT